MCPVHRSASDGKQAQCTREPYMCPEFCACLQPVTAAIRLNCLLDSIAHPSNSNGGDLHASSTVAACTAVHWPHLANHTCMHGTYCIGLLQVEQFEDILEHHVELSFFVPLIMGHGGNTGSQAVTTVIRYSTQLSSSQDSAPQHWLPQRRCSSTISYALTTVG